MFSENAKQIAASYTGKTLRGFARSKNNAVIVAETDFLPADAGTVQRFWHIQRNTDAPPGCELCGKSVKWQDGPKRYSRFCSTKCSANSERTRVTKEETNLSRYGVGNPFQDAGIKEQIAQAHMRNLGVPHPMKSKKVREKAESTHESRHGTRHPLQNAQSRERFKQTNLKRRGVKSPFQDESVKQKMVRSFKQKYGTDHPMQNTEHRKAVEQTNLERYGVRNPFQDEKVKGQIREQFQEKFGVANTTQVHIPESSWPKLKDPDWLQEEHHTKQKNLSQIARELGVSPTYMCRTMYKFGIEILRFCRSEAEIEVHDFIQSVYPDSVVTNSRNVIPPYEIDIFLPDLNLAIEFHGLYWHSEEQKGRLYHRKKFDACEKRGIRLIQILENEWTSKRDIVESEILDALNLTKKIKATDTKVFRIGKKLEHRFLQANHIQGYVPSSIAYGLVRNKKLFGLMSFGKPENIGSDWEMLRFCTLRGYSVLGGSQKLFRHFCKKNTGSIVSYCDLRWNTGAFFESLDFNRTDTTEPNYWYFRDGNRVYSKTDIQGQKLPKLLEDYDSELTEYANMLSHGWGRIWDCGNAVYTRNIGREHVHTPEQ